ncbi:peptide/nickel transport system ATP-binding protein/glutathione transport system ATP-binding protein [Devosia sp. YR412]|uniref:ABC transporter ATP-binding protein n=1 Tax=Devosia sp. YR412 TaxID=1881030 RepID=UPI0008B0FE45|nr:ABC transporter ATP-binding protein [Devosia sp. YR412]SEP64173.1 peptide/nickel transport system ATP-binding protein/glutathione transport system ATP-binding protein [Devosia sp. YR412]
MSANALLVIENLSISFGRGDKARRVVEGLDFSVAPGECVAVVGESGSGKSVTAFSVLGLTGFNGGTIETGSINFRRRDGSVVDLARADERLMQSSRGDEIAMVFQEPMTALNPVFTVGEQIAEVLRQHRGMDRQQAAARALELITRVQISDPARRFTQYPHELSGGMRQRVVIAMALACSPRLLVADEPTTALDVTIQAQVLDLMRDLAREEGMALLFITHDMGVVAEMADRVVVMRKGRKVEEQAVAKLFAQPRETYTRALLNAVPKLGSMAGTVGPLAFGADPKTARPAPTVNAPLLEVKNLSTWFPIYKGLLKRHVGDVKAVDDVSFSIGRGETLSLVGESGSGKSTTGRSILRLAKPHAGQVLLEGQDVLKLDREAMRAKRRDMQIVFQDPYAALDPRLDAFEQIVEPLVIHGVDKGSALRDRAVELVRRVGLEEEHLDRYPHEFSGGQRQRLCIARALSLSPKLIIADESVSALDVSIQAQVVNLLIELQQELGLSYLFISHDMGVVERISHRVAVMQYGRIVEMGTRAQIFEAPSQAYTRALIAAVPVADPTRGHYQSTKTKELIPA